VGSVDGTRVIACEGRPLLVDRALDSEHLPVSALLRGRARHSRGLRDVPHNPALRSGAECRIMRAGPLTLVGAAR
jgi:hypothetical protein